MKIKFKAKIDEKRLQSLCEDAIKQTLPDVMNAVADDIKQIYMDAIDQYYLYPTRMYIRHGESKPYTKTGSNLYSAIEIYAKKVGTKHGIYFDLNYENLLPYDDNRLNVQMVIYGQKTLTHSNRHDSKEKVLNMITSGYRLRESGSSGPVKWYLPIFNSKYFEIKSKTIDGIANDIGAQFSKKVSRLVAVNAINKIRGEIFE